MKLITAIIQPDRLEQVREALVARDVTRITISRCSGYGRTSNESLYRGETVPDVTPKVRIEIGVNDDFVEPTIEAIIQAARHGEGSLGDGKIFVQNLEECIRIRTGERGGGAI